MRFISRRHIAAYIARKSTACIRRLLIWSERQAFAARFCGDATPTATPIYELRSRFARLATAPSTLKPKRTTKESAISVISRTNPFAPRYDDIRGNQPTNQNRSNPMTNQDHEIDSSSIGFFEIEPEAVAFWERLDDKTRTDYYDQSSVDISDYGDFLSYIEESVSDEDFRNRKELASAIKSAYSQRDPIVATEAALHTAGKAVRNAIDALWAADKQFRAANDKRRKQCLAAKIALINKGEAGESTVSDSVWQAEKIERVNVLLCNLCGQADSSIRALRDAGDEALRALSRWQTDIIDSAPDSHHFKP